MAGQDREPGIERFPSGIPGLDEILRGGLLVGAAYIVNGVPGAGKTILANQICFNHVAGGGRAVYLTLLAELHTRMLQHLRPMSFFDEQAIPDRLTYLGAFKVLEEEGLGGLLDLLQREMRGAGATLMILDGLVAAEEAAPSPREFKKFVHELQIHAAANGCTVLLLTTGGIGQISPEHTMVDGIIELDDELFGVRTARSLQVRKFRGSGFLRGRHAFRITSDGLVVHPRIEAIFAMPSRRDRPPVARVSTGTEGLDRMLGGGLIAGTTTIVMGPTGIGKTTLGFHFLSGATAEEPGLFFGFYETPERLRLSAREKGIDLEGLEARGAVEIVWQPQGEHALDELGHRLLDAVLRRGAHRLFLDGVGGLLESAIHPDRISRYISVLANEIRALGVTSILTMETREIVAPTVQVPINGISSLSEGLIVLRYTELDAALLRTASVLKIRDSDFDPRLHVYEITGKGLHILGPYRERYEEILSGSAHRRPEPPAAANPGEE
ncbi:ATPase domain-containing protein [Arenibaculum pallidiluteum]|uniref:ATPase domain-containing protein n=1 Tax=Arenibaculum pallidiluteum TaxID=2812559 RepID=UPI001A97A06F|nr:ATPase domain-containing protein [Arenibaculum pallidiluteum]